MKTNLRAHLFALALLLGASSAFGATATSVSQRSFTWTFDQAYTVGQFVNGDWYVVEPSPGAGVRVIEITPKDPYPTDATDIHCSAINIIPSVTSRYKSPLESRALSDYIYYQPELNIAKKLPLLVPAGSSITSVKSSPGTKQNESKNWFDDAAVLTVLAQVPPPNSFRPPYAGTDKKIRGTKADLDFNMFRNYPQIAGAPSTATLSSELQGVLLDTLSQWPNTNFKANTGGPSYGRDITRVAAEAALILNLDYPQATKEELLIHLVQRGIDTFGTAKAGMRWAPNGGHNSGRKLFMVIAARALQDSEMLSWCSGASKLIFQEDTQHWYITQKDVDTPRFSSTSEPFTVEMIGMPEWASNPITEAHKTGSQWDTNGYRFVNGSVNCAVVLAVNMMGLKDVWNWPAFFEYIETRYYPIESVTPTTNVIIPSWHRALWKAYAGPQPPNPPTMLRIVQ